MSIRRRCSDHRIDRVGRHRIVPAQVAQFDGGVRTIAQSIDRRAGAGIVHHQHTAVSGGRKRAVRTQGIDGANAPGHAVAGLRVPALEAPVPQHQQGAVAMRSTRSTFFRPVLRTRGGPQACASMGIQSG